jgi:cytochrome P450
MPDPGFEAMTDDAPCEKLGGVRPIGAVSAWVRERPTRRARRAAWDRYRDAIASLDEAQRAYQSAPNEMTAEQLLYAEIEHGDAIAIAGEFEAMDLSWGSGGTRQVVDLP